MSKIVNKQRDKANLIISNRKNANLFVDIISDLEDDNTEVVMKAINDVTRVCEHLLNTNVFTLGSNNQKANNKENPQQVYSAWMKERYRDACSGVFSLFSHVEESVRDLVVTSILKLLKAEAKNKNSSEKFPVQLLLQVVTSVVTAESKESNPFVEDFIQKFQQRVCIFDDVRFYEMKALQNAVSKFESKPVSLERTFRLMKDLNMPRCQDDVPLENFFIKQDESDGAKYSSLKEQKKLFTSLWMEFLALELSPDLYKDVLEVLHIKVMPFMSNPLPLSDFLILSSSLGGAVGLLALNGLFILMTAYNLDYPDFYKKLYTLLEPSIFCVPHTSQFLSLLDTFLKSTHLPAGLIAAFIKRLARISLVLPQNLLPSVMTLVINLLIRHPNCQVLVHKIQCSNSSAQDPYDSREQDPLKTKALESSLWEIKSLQNHFLVSICDLARKINGKLPTIELPYERYLNNDYTTLMNKISKKNYKDAPEYYVAKNSTVQPLGADVWSL